MCRRKSSFILAYRTKKYTFMKKYVKINIHHEFVKINLIQKGLKIHLFGKFTVWFRTRYTVYHFYKKDIWKDMVINVKIY